MFDNNEYNENDEDFQDEEEERHEEEWQEQLEKEKEGRIWDNRRLSDFDILKGIMQSEYGNNEFSNSAELTETRDYDLNLERNNPDRENLRKRANYIMLSPLLGQLEGADFVIPSFDVMESYGTIKNIKPRFGPKTGRFLGIDYRTDPFKPFKEIIVYWKGGILRHTRNKTLKPLLDDFRNEVVRSSEIYQEMSNGIIDSEMKWDGYLDSLIIDRGPPEGWVEAKKEKDRVRAEIKREYLTQIEAGMDELFPKLLNEFETLKVSERNGVPYTGYIQNIMRPISHMTWYGEKDVPKDVYDREVAVMEEERGDIENRIKDSLSVREQKAYKDLFVLPRPTRGEFKYIF